MIPAVYYLYFYLFAISLFSIIAFARYPWAITNNAIRANNNIKVADLFIIVFFIFFI